MSAPAANAFCDPVRTMAATFSEVFSSPRALLSSLIRGVHKAFSAFGPAERHFDEQVNMHNMIA